MNLAPIDITIPEDGFIDDALALECPKTIRITKRAFTRGCWAHGANWHRMLKKGTKLTSFSGLATLTLSPDAPLVDHNNYKHPDLQVLSSEGGSDGLNVSVESIIIDCNESAFPPDVSVTSGLRATGYNAITNCQVIGLRGNYASKLEAFGFSFYGSGFSVLTYCTVHKCAGNSYVSAFNFGHTSGLGVTASFCTANLGTGNWLAFGLNRNVRMANCTASDARFALYNDTDETDNCVVRDFTAKGVEYGLALRHPTGAGPRPAYKGNVLIHNSSFELRPDTYGAARVIELWDEDATIEGKKFRGHEFGQVVFLNCKFTVTAEVKSLYRSSIVTFPQAVEPDVTFAACDFPKDVEVLTHGRPSKILCPPVG